MIDFGNFDEFERTAGHAVEVVKQVRDSVERIKEILVSSGGTSDDHIQNSNNKDNDDVSENQVVAFYQPRKKRKRIGNVPNRHDRRRETKEDFEWENDYFEDFFDGYGDDHHRDHHSKKRSRRRRASAKDNDDPYDDESFQDEEFLFDDPFGSHASFFSSLGGGASMVHGIARALHNGDHRHIRNVVNRAKHRHRAMFSSFSNSGAPSNVGKTTSSSRRGDRRLWKSDQCSRLVDCASKMSHYDLFVYYNSDDIDPNSGAVGRQRDKLSIYP